MTSNIESNLGDFFIFQTTGDFISSMIGTSIIIAALASLIYFVFGGISWTISGDDKTKVEQAQKTMTNAIIGLAITVSAYAIWSIAKSFFGLDETIITN